MGDNGQPSITNYKKLMMYPVNKFEKVVTSILEGNTNYRTCSRKVINLANDTTIVSKARLHCGKVNNNP